MKKLFTALCMCVFVLMCLFILPTHAEAASENSCIYTVKNSEATLTSDISSGDIDVPFDPVKKVRRIWIATVPAKVVYQLGEDLDTTGMVVKATYSDGSSMTVTNYTVSGYSVNTIGEQTITVTFGGKTATFIVTVDSPDYTYTVENGAATVTGYTGAGGDIIIPATLGGYPVTTIGDSAFHNCTSLTSVIIGNSITTIDASAFHSCSGLADVSIPNSVTTIGRGAFNLCHDLTDVYYNGTQSQWNNIDIKSFNEDLITANIHFDGEHVHSFTNYVSDENATYDADGTKTATCDYCEETDTVTDKGSKLIRNGWFSMDGKWYYYKNDAKATGWLKSGSVYYYMDANGVMTTGWQLVGGKWYFMNASGAMQTGWLQSGSVWYYLDGSGAMATGWKLVGGVYYYFNGSGVMQTGWLQSGNTWYYLKSSGAMATGWAQDSGKWYYFNASGAMQTGWQKVGATWYYFQSGGAMQTGWLKDGGTWYYFGSSGAMATGSVKIGTKTYNFAASGACLNP